MPLSPVLSARTRLISLVAGGNAAGQIITLAAAPVLARLYTPDAFGQFAVIGSIASVAAAAATLSFDQAIHVPPDRETAAGVTRLALLFSHFTSALSLLLTAVWILAVSGPAHGWLLPLLIGCNAAAAVFGNWANREGQFATLVRARLIGAITGTVATLALFRAEAFGLLGGQVLGAFATAVWLGIAFRRTAPASAASPPRAELWRRFSFYPLWRLPADLLNTAVSQLPLWIFGHVFGAGTAGHFSLVHRLYHAPAMLVGNALREVFAREAGQAYRATRHCGVEFDHYARTLALLGLAVCLPVVCFGPSLFAFVFGEPWREAGALARWLGLWYFLRFAISPLTTMLILGTRPGIDLALQVFLGAGFAGAWFYATRTTSLPGTITILTATTFLFYGANFIVSRQLAHGKLAPGHGTPSSSSA